MFGWLSRRFFSHLEAEIAWLRAEVRYEKARADRALDMLASVQLGRPVTTAYPAPPPEQASPPSDEEIRKLMQSADFAQAGMG